MIRFDIEISDFADEAILSKLGIQDHGPVQQFIDESVIEFSKPYWAWRTGALANSANNSDIGSGEIVYDVPYAHDMYYGTKVQAYNLEHNPLAGPYPIERMKADRLTEIVDGVKRIAGNQ